MTPREAALAEVDALAGRSPFWGRRLREALVAAAPLDDLEPVLLCARYRRATALVASGWGETEHSEREVPLIRALAALEAETAGGCP